MSSNNNKIRDCGPMEYYFANNKYDSYKMLINNFIVHSKIDLFEHQNQVFNAIKNWKTMHPFLNVNVYLDEHEKHEAYYRYKEDNANYNFENVKFLSLKSHDESLIDSEDENYAFKLIIERESFLKFNVQCDLLWRLVFFRFRTKDEEKDSTRPFKYGIIFNTQHLISDFKNHLVNFSSNFLTFFFFLALCSNLSIPSDTIIQR
jgi:hypothetical protein